MLREPSRAWSAAACALLLACGEQAATGDERACPSADVTQFHGDARRLGWRDREPELSPAALSASPRGCAGSEHDPGEIVWRRQLGNPLPIESLDGGMPMGVLSTPVIDLDRDEPRLYAAALDASAGWQVFALELATGLVLDGWPVPIDDAALAAVNSNGPARFQQADAMSQRSALALSPDGARLYVAFGTYRGQGVGWLVAIDTQQPAIAHAFSSAPFSEQRSNGGIWGAPGRPWPPTAACT